jgi:hypothetical protein
MNFLPIKKLIPLKIEKLNVQRSFDSTAKTQMNCRPKKQLKNTFSRNSKFFILMLKGQFNDIFTSDFFTDGLFPCPVFKDFSIFDCISAIIYSGGFIVQHGELLLSAS